MSADDRDDEPERRTFLKSGVSVAMAGGLCASYGTFAVMSGRYLYPAKADAKTWLYVKDIASFDAGSALDFVTPSGAKAVIARRGDTGGLDDFIALSSVCPHLGCQVHWEGHKNRFFCPCHNGVFDPDGVATSGPPADDGQALLHFPLRVENGLLFIEAPVATLASNDDVDAGEDEELA